MIESLTMVATRQVGSIAEHDREGTRSRVVSYGIDCSPKPDLAACRSWAYVVICDEKSQFWCSKQARESTEGRAGNENRHSVLQY